MGNKVKKIYMRKKAPRLPDAYQEVDYIQSSGTQYMVIGTSFKTSYKVVIDFQMTVIGGDYIPIGIHYSSSSSTNIKYGIDAYSSYFKVAGGDWSNTIPEDTNRHIITIDKNVATVDGTNYTINYTNYTFSQGIGVFCYNEIHLSQYNYKSSNKLYKLDIYDESGSHIYNLVPCYRKSDNVIGLYDLVNNQFYTNAGSGTFTKGTDSSTLELKEFQVWPDDQRQLRDETDMANSTTGSSGVIASTNGKFIRPSYSFGGGNGAYSKGTIDGYDVLVASSQHGNVHIGLSDANYTDLMSHKKVKIVWDYFNLGANQSNYTNGIWFGGNESLTDTSSSSTITVGSNWSGMSFSYSTGYSMEQVINTSDMSCTTTITNLSNQAKSTFTYTKVFSRETNSTYIINGGGNRFIWMNDDYGGGPVRAGNIHVYYTD